VLPPRERKTNVYTRDGQSLVVKVPHFNGDYLPRSVRTAVDMLGGLEKAFKPGDSVILKPNFNCAYATPLSTDLTFLGAVIEVLQDFGLKVSVGELSGRAAWPTEKVIADLGVLPVLKRYGVPFVNFQYDEWVEVGINSEHWPSIHVPRSIYEADKRIYLPNFRCHSSGRYSAALKLGVGWISPDDREIMHSDKKTTEAMIAELNLAFQPDLIIMDGRRSTVEWAGRGPYVYPNVIMASGDMVAIDAEAVRILKTFPSENRIQIPLEQIGQLATAASLGLGSMDALIVEAPANTHTEEANNLDPATLAVKDTP
jgi:uncharacterized protein (DUF362 family)